MKLINVVVFYVLYLLILGSLVSGGVAYGKLYKKCETEKQKYECIRFVSESFRKTCDGSGFSNLNEWQKVCRGLCAARAVAGAASPMGYSLPNFGSRAGLGPYRHRADRPGPGPC